MDARPEDATDSQTADDVGRSGHAGARAEVAPATDEPEDHCLNALPFVYDMTVAQPQNKVVTIDEFNVAIVVSLLSLVAAVELLTIAFDYEPVSDEKVDPSGAGPMHLDSNADPEPS